MSIHEECGVFGIFNRNLEHNAVQETYLALYALQHRGQVSCGIAARNGDNVDCITELGTVPDVFNKDKLASLTASGNGNVAIGHVRYSAQGRRRNKLTAYGYELCKRLHLNRKQRQPCKHRKAQKQS